jgi:hypothetical protein
MVVKIRRTPSESPAAAGERPLRASRVEETMDDRHELLKRVLRDGYAAAFARNDQEISP